MTSRRRRPALTARERGWRLQDAAELLAEAAGLLEAAGAPRAAVLARRAGVSARAVLRHVERARPAAGPVEVQRELQDLGDPLQDLRDLQDELEARRGKGCGRPPEAACGCVTSVVDHGRPGTCARCGRKSDRVNSNVDKADTCSNM